MKIYTRVGDKGSTRLAGGTEVPKNDYRIEACGTIDELNSWLGLIRSQDIDQYDSEVIIKLQGLLMTISCHIADEKKILTSPAMPDDQVIDWLEKEIDRLEKHLPPLKSFIIPGGNTVAGWCHLARSVCRRSERRLVPVIEKLPELSISMKLLNRLSDYLYIVARKVTKDFNCEEKIWNPLL